MEQYWHSILEHDGIGRRRYHEITEIGKELKELSEHIVDAKVSNKVAVIKSYDNNWSHENQPHNYAFNYNELLQEYYDTLHNNGFNCDVISIDAAFK